MTGAYPLFSRYGVELEYMIVDERTLDIRPWADRLIQRVAGQPVGDVARGTLAWSNELALHVIELKTRRPAPSLAGLAAAFQIEVAGINRLLSRAGARLLPTAMHPWMDPRRESRLWPHECGEIYQAFDRIFNCQGHGWTNLQSTHLNLPFATANDFRRLHTAIRLLLPLLPALASSSPFVEGHRGPALDMRLEFYQRNCARVPSLTAAVVPEPILSPAAYERQILQKLYRDLTPHDPEGILHHEWVNARGAIPRFERNTIEIRLLDIQECPAADLALLAFLSAILESLVDESLSPLALQRQPSTAALAALLEATVHQAGSAQVRSPAIARAFGMRGSSRMTARDLWRHLFAACPCPDPSVKLWIEFILEEGTVSQRILHAAGPRPEPARLRSVYRELARCLDEGLPFLAPRLPRRPTARRRRMSVVISCEHAHCAIPRRYAVVARSAGRHLRTHRGYDPGALELARRLAQRLEAPLFCGRHSRLLIELNRSPSHPALWSPFSKALSEADKLELLQGVYGVYRAAVEQAILRRLLQSRPVLHLSVHSFTPVLRGKPRDADVGLLFDPRRARERQFCQHWQHELENQLPGLDVRFNYPYRGTADGFTTALRRKWTDGLYLGVELEVNQKFPRRAPQHWLALQTALAESLARLLRTAWEHRAGELR